MATSPPPAGLINDCDECYEQRINQCVDQLLFVLGLTAGETYFFTFTDNHGKEHVVEVVADVAGNATINATDLPPGFFIVYSGVKTVTWKQSGCADICFIPCEVEPGNDTQAQTTYCCIVLQPVDRGLDFTDEIIETVPCCAEGTIEIIDFASIEFGCNEPPTSGTIAGNYTVVNGSGYYGLQVYFNDTWNTVPDVVTPPPFSFVLNNGTLAPGNYPVRIIDTDTLIFSNEQTLTVAQCDASESLEILSITAENCTDGNLDATVNSSIVNAVGSIEIWVNGFLNGTVGASTLISFSAVQGMANVPMFLRDSISGIESPLFYYSFMSCPGGDTIIILQANSGCTGTQQGTSAQVETNYDNIGHNFALQYFDVVWIQIAASMGVGMPQFYLSSSTNVPPGDHLIRVVDLTDSIFSISQTLFFNDCEPSELVFDSLILTTPGAIGGESTATNLYEANAAALNIIIEISDDGISGWAQVVNLNGALPGQPYTGAINFNAGSASFESGKWLRLYGADVAQSPVYSNQLPILSAPVLTKVEPDCNANQQEVTIGGQVDINSPLLYWLEYTPTGSGDPWVAAGSVLAVAGIIPDTIFAIGAGNEFASVNMDFRLRNDQYPYLVSATVTAPMELPC